MLSSIHTPGCRVPAGKLTKHARRLGLLMMMMLAPSACIPLRFNTSPGASGVVLDSRTRSPIDGAEVLVSRLTYPPPSVEAALTNSRPPTVITTNGGQFSIPAERRLDLYVVPIDIFPRFGMLVIKHEGYESTLLPFWSRSVTDVGEVELTPVSKSSEEKRGIK
jgi:hypothetical protein